jgi:hypothetical protein
MTSFECEELLVSLGYKKEAHVPSDRALYKRNMLYGIREMLFVKNNPDCKEMCTVILFDDKLFRISVNYEDFKQGFADKVVSSVTDNLSVSFRAMRGPNSDMRMYIWETGVTLAQFRHHEIPKMKLLMATLEYVHLPSFSQLRKLGLQ